MSEGPTRVRAPSQVVRYSKIRVDVTRGPNAGAWVELVERPIGVGTSADNDLILTDDTVSRYHCEIEPVAGGIRVRDAGSTNGVFVGKTRVFDAVVALDAGPLRLGDTELTLRALGEVVERVQAKTDRFGDVLGKAPRMRELFADLERIASTDVTLLIEGETGTGKDLLAESVHRASARANGPYVVFDCSAVNQALVESELFGHERGAFSGATEEREGVFEQANGGTLFLDEVSELPRDLQPKLLRAIENRQIRRLGGGRVIDLDIRVIAATNRHLRAEVARGEFREDLYFRLAAAHVISPPLRDRLEDLAFLVEHFLSLENPPRPVSEVPPHVWSLFESYRWPGNVRELRNAVQRLVLTPDRPLRDLGAELGQAATPPPAADAPLHPLRIARREASDAFERAYLAAAMAKTGNNVTRAAVMADVSRQMMQKLLRKHGRPEGNS